MKQILRFFDTLAHVIIGILAIMLIMAILGGCVFMTRAAYDHSPWMGVVIGLVCFSGIWIVGRDIIRTDG